MVYERVLAIGHDHPSLAGHFPGHPVVPGVVLLNEVLATLRQGAAAPLTVKGLPIVKFSAPLKPGEPVTIRVEQGTGGAATFSCRVADRLIASGTIEYAVDTAAQAERV